MTEKEPNGPAAGDEPAPESQPVTVTADDAAGGGEAGADAGGNDGGAGGGGSRTPLVLALVALVLVVGLAGAGGYGGWWLWQRLQQTEAEAMAAASGYLKPEALEQRASALGERIRSLDARLSNLNEQVGGRGDAIAAVRERVDGLKQAQSRLDERMAAIEELARTSKDEWQRSEAAYLATVAIHRLRYYRDVDAALGALKEAHELLADFGGEEIEARKGVARAIDRLIEVDPPRIENLMQRLARLGERVEGLPAATGPEALMTEGGAAGDETDTPRMQGEGWRERAGHAWGQFTGALGELVEVSNERKVAPLRTPEERFFLIQNLKVQIETARMAALRGDQSAYDNSLKRLLGWLDTYFDSGDPAVSGVREGVAALQGAPVTVDLPDIAPLLERVRAFD